MTIHDDGVSAFDAPEGDGVNPPASRVDESEVNPSSGALVNPAPVHDGVLRYIPAIDGLTRSDAAKAYMGAGLTVFPCDGKQPVKVNGKRARWSEQSSGDPEMARQWSKAYWFPGGEDIPHRKGIAVDLGKCGCLVIDVDRPELVPAEWWPILDEAPFTSTDSEDPRRGHYFFLQPDEPVGCPVGLWGEVKGDGGYVILAGSPHAAADLTWPDNQTPEHKYRATARYEQVRTGGMFVLPPDIADSFGEHRRAKAAASLAQVQEFTNSCTSTGDWTDPGMAGSIVAHFMDLVSKDQGRHPSLIKCLVWAAKAGRAGLTDAVMVRNTLENLFAQVKPEAYPTEFSDAWAWAIGQATEEEAEAFRLQWTSKSEAYWNSRLPDAPPIDLWAADRFTADGNIIPGQRIEARDLGQVDFGPGPAPVDIVDRPVMPGQRTDSPDPAVTAAPEPIPLFAPDAEPYDMPRFGRMGQIAQAFADGLGVSPDMTIVGMLSAASTVCGGKVYVEVEERDWKQPVIFHGINLAPPGGMKSDAGKACWKPIMDLQKERREAMKSEAELADLYLDICDSRIDKLKKDAVRVTNPADREQIEADLMAEVNKRAELEANRTTPCRLWANDTTPEALVENMARQDGRMAILDTEPRFLKIMAGGAGRKGGNPDPSVMLAGYDQDAGSRDRITNRTEVILEKPSLTIGIFTQPKRFASIAADNVEMDEGGAWGRFFFSVPTGTRLRTREIQRVSKEVTDEHASRIRAMFYALYESKEDVVVTLTPEAEELFLAHWLARDPELAPQEQRVCIDGWDAKEEGRALRIAVLMEMYENPQSREIGVERIRDVIAISDTMRTHARAASEHIATMEGNPLAPAREVLEWIRQAMPKGTVTATSVLNALRKKHSKTVVRLDHALDALKVLEDYNWVRPSMLDDRGKGDLRMFSVHPSLRAPGVVENAEAAPVGSGEPAPVIPEEPKSRMQELADDIEEIVVTYCDTAPPDGSGDPGDWKLQASELYELYCELKDLTPVDGMSPEEKEPIPEERRIDRIRFGAAFKEKFPGVEVKRTGRGAGKIRWYTGMRFKADRPPAE